MPGADVGLGWMINRAAGLHGHPGAGPGVATSLVVRPETGGVAVACTNRTIPIARVSARLVRELG